MVITLNKSFNKHNSIKKIGIFGSRREGEQVGTTSLKSLEIENILGIPLCNHLLHWTTLISDTNAFKTQSSNA